MASAAERYSKVESKLQRSMIVTDIVDTIRKMGNGFVRRCTETGEWVECSDVMCREKVGQHFRNALGAQYKSSTRSKSERRAKASVEKYMKKHADLAAERTAFVRAHGGVGPALFAAAQVRQQDAEKRKAEAAARAGKAAGKGKDARRDDDGRRIRVVAFDAQ